MPFHIMLKHELDAGGDDLAKRGFNLSFFLTHEPHKEHSFCRWYYCTEATERM
jgi:hypothetical protein